MAKKVSKENKESKEKTFKGDVLHSNDDKAVIQRKGLEGKTTLRRARYWCYRFRNEAHGGADANDAPDGFKEFIESLPGFTDWKFFAERWDLIGENPFMIVHRILSVWQEWEHVMDRVAVPIDATKEEIEARVQSLTKDYARRFGGSV